MKSNADRTNVFNFYRKKKSPANLYFKIFLLSWSVSNRQSKVYMEVAIAGTHSYTVLDLLLLRMTNCTQKRPTWKFDANLFYHGNPWVLPNWWLQLCPTTIICTEPAESNSPSRTPLLTYTLAPLLLGLPVGLSHSALLAKLLYEFFLSYLHFICTYHLILIDSVTSILFD